MAYSLTQGKSEIVTVLSKGRKQECKNEKRNLIKVNQAWFQDMKMSRFFYRVKTKDVNVQKSQVLVGLNLIHTHECKTIY